MSWNSNTTHIALRAGITLFVITLVYIVKGFTPIRHEDRRIVKCLSCLMTENFLAIFIKLSSWRRNTNSSLSLSSSDRIHYALLIEICRTRDVTSTGILSGERYYGGSVTVVKSLASFDNFWSPTRDQFTVTALSPALFEIQAVCKAVAENSTNFTIPSDSSPIVPHDRLVTVS